MYLIFNFLGITSWLRPYLSKYKHDVGHGHILLNLLLTIWSFYYDFLTVTRSQQDLQH